MEERKQEAKRALAVPDSAAEEGIVARQPALLLAGKRKRIITEKGREALAQIREFWAECEADGTLAALRDLAPDARCYVAANHNFEKYAYDYWIAIEVLEEEPQLPAGFETLQTEETEYALFPCKGPGLKSAFERWGFVYRKWFRGGIIFMVLRRNLRYTPSVIWKRKGMRASCVYLLKRCRRIITGAGGGPCG